MSDSSSEGASSRSSLYVEEEEEDSMWEKYADPSGVATGWHGWTMSRGPGAKGAPERERQEKE